jgi:hypothetical protein
VLDAGGGGGGAAEHRGDRALRSVASLNGGIAVGARRGRVASVVGGG